MYRIPSILSFISVPDIDEHQVPDTAVYRYIPYLADTDYMSESEYLHCGDRLQSAVTHSGRTNNIWVVSFQWRPPQHFSGHVTFR